ncbi:MAG: S-methyl-5-thioribose kinase [Alphaproteobacteria bacterium]
MTSPLGRATSYRPHDRASLVRYLAAIPRLARLIGGEPSAWQVDEVGDGNLNLVFKVRGPAGGVAVKQSLPYVRMVGESWPLSLERSHYEHLALVEQARHAPGLVPAIHHYDASQALFVMDLLEPHIILRRGMIAGTVYPGLAEALAGFAARTLYFTSVFALRAEAMKALIGAFAGNTAMCGISEDLFFTEPYMMAPNNRWTAPYLDSYAAALREDDELKIAVSRLKLKFMGETQALLHGDLHTGSIMVTETDVRVIDPEFAFVGPMGFDLGSLIANLLLSYLSQDGHERGPGERDAYRDWIIEQVETFWSAFRERFLALWREAPAGDGYPVVLFESSASARRLDAEREAWMDRLYQDTLGFVGTEMIRRIVGLAHNIDFEWIADPARRARCEARGLRLASELIVAPQGYASIGALTAAVRELRAWEPFG